MNRLPFDDEIVAIQFPLWAPFFSELKYHQLIHIEAEDWIAFPLFTSSELTLDFLRSTPGLESGFEPEEIRNIEELLIKLDLFEIKGITHVTIDSRGIESDSKFQRIPELRAALLDTRRHPNLGFSDN